MEAVIHSDIDVTDETRRQALAENLYKLLRARQWSPSDLSRAAGINRENTSRYLRGVSLPSDRILQKIASALKVEPGELVPGAIWNPPLPLAKNEEFRAVPSTVPGLVRLTVDKHVSPATAARIMEILAEEPTLRAANRG